MNRPEAPKDPDFMAKIYDCLGIWSDEGALAVSDALHTPLLQNLFLYLVRTVIRNCFTSPFEVPSVHR